MENDKDLECCVTTCGLPLNANYWDQQYINSETGWDLQAMSPPLKEYIDSIEDKSIAVLIPGCGNAYEAEYMLELGFSNVTVIDISSTLVNRLKEKWEGKNVRIVHGDFFEIKDSYDLILEQTFFCALNPSLRERYVYQCFNILKTGGKLAGLLFDKIFEKSGPPFGGKREDYAKLFSPMFEFLRFESCKNSVSPRLGSELFLEFKKKEIPAAHIQLLKLTGISCVGCSRSLISMLSSVDGVVSCSVNSDYNELLVVTNRVIGISELQMALSSDSGYILHQST